MIQKLNQSMKNPPQANSIYLYQLGMYDNQEEHPLTPREALTLLKQCQYLTSLSQTPTLCLYLLEV